MIISDEEATANVTKLPVKFKTPAPPELSLVLDDHTKCRHWEFSGAQYIVDEALAEVTCSLCNEKLNPMWVLNQIAKRESRMLQAHERYVDEMKRLKERSRTKCDSCGKMTRISR